MNLRSQATSNVLITSRCRLLDVVGSFPSAGLGTLAGTTTVESTSWRAGVAMGTATWSADNVVWNVSMDTTAATPAFIDGMIHRFMHF
jgi:hypothetical protein